jgi:hypothetical protein
LPQIFLEPGTTGLDATMRRYDFTGGFLEASREQLKCRSSGIQKRDQFEPQAFSSLGKALEEISERLGVSGDEEKRQALAKFINRLAQEDGNLDAAALRDRAVAALGGVEFSALFRISQSSDPAAPAE